MCLDKPFNISLLISVCCIDLITLINLVIYMMNLINFICWHFLLKQIIRTQARNAYSSLSS